MFSITFYCFIPGSLYLMALRCSIWNITRPQIPVVFGEWAFWSLSSSYTSSDTGSQCSRNDTANNTFQTSPQFGFCMWPRCAFWDLDDRSEECRWWPCGETGSSCMLWWSICSLVPAPQTGSADSSSGGVSTRIVSRCGCVYLLDDLSWICSSQA